MKLVIDPTQEITNYQRTNRELEIFLLFAILVAGKQAARTATLLSGLLAGCPAPRLPRRWLASHSDTELLHLLQQHRTGQYQRIFSAIRGSAGLPLRKVTVSQLEAVKGIGPKTARFFVLHSQAGAREVVLDTHILKYIRSRGIDAPLTTPQSHRQYARLSETFLTLVDVEFPGLSVAEADFQIWLKLKEQRK